mgnify:CR=1 FL=1
MLLLKIALLIFFGEILVYNSLINEEDVADKRGADYVKKTMHELNMLLNSSGAVASKERIKNLMKSIGLETHLSLLGIRTERDIELIFDSVNIERLENNPRSLTKPSIKEILYKII